MNENTLLVFWTFLCLASTLFFEIKSFSPLNIHMNADAKIAVCHFTKTAEPRPIKLAICGFKGETCSISFYTNKSEAQIKKAVKCDCWNVFVDTDQSIIQGNFFSTTFFAEPEWPSVLQRRACCMRHGQSWV